MASSPCGATLSIGLVLDNERVAWGVCPVPGDNDLTVAAAAGAIQQRVAPVLQGQRLDSFRRLAAKIDALTETVTINEHRPQPKREKQAGKFSRRDLFTGRLWSPESPQPPQTREITVERPLHAAIRYGVSQALLVAVAMGQKKSIAEAIAAEYGLPGAATAIPAHVSLGPPGDEATSIVNALLAHQAASLGYTIAADEDKAQLGSSGEFLQQHVRRLQTHIAAAATAYQPFIHLELNGGLGRLLENNPGKILGALYGLEQAAAPYPVRVVDALVMDDREAQISALRQLKGYLRIRRMRLELVASAWVDTREDADAFIEAEAIHAIQLNAPRLGSLHQTIEAIQTGREKGVTTLLAGDGCADGRSAQILAHVALATQPEAFVASGLSDWSLVYNEMVRWLAWPGQ